MKKIFLAHNQIIKLKIKLVDLSSLFTSKKPGKVKFVLRINNKITPDEFQIKKEEIDSKTFSIYCRPFIHTFPVKSYKYLETPVLGEFWKFDIYMNDECIYSKRSTGAIICERKRFIERTIGDYLERYLHYHIKFFSGANNPDLIIKDQLCNSAIQGELTEKTNPDGQLTYEKFRKDLDKYIRYQQEGRFPSVKHLLIIPCAAGISRSIEPHIGNFVSIVTFNDLYNLLYSLKYKKDNITSVDTVKNIITNSGIQKSPRKYITKITPFEEKRVIVYRIDFTRNFTCSETPAQYLLQISDINPFEVIKIIEIAKNYDGMYRSKSKLKEILLEPDNLAVINKNRPNSHRETIEQQIKKENWLIPSIQLGYLDNNCKITEKGLFLLELLNKQYFSHFDRETIRRLMGYDFLNAPGIKEFLILINETYADPLFKKSQSKGIFSDILTRKMVEKHLVFSITQAKRDCEDLFRWLRIFGYCDVFTLNFQKIKEDYNLEDYSLEESVDERT